MSVFSISGVGPDQHAECRVKQAACRSVQCVKFLRQQMKRRVSTLCQFVSCTFTNAIVFRVVSTIQKTADDAEKQRARRDFMPSLL